MRDYLKTVIIILFSSVTNWMQVHCLPLVLLLLPASHAAAVPAAYSPPYAAAASHATALGSAAVPAAYSPPYAAAASSRLPQPFNSFARSNPLSNTPAQYPPKFSSGVASGRPPPAFTVGGGGSSSTGQLAKRAIKDFRHLGHFSTSNIGNNALKLVFF